jgi:hypothetical protein
MNEETRDVANKQGGALATIDFVSDSGMGLETIEKTDLALPFLKLLQSGSDETKKKHAKYVEGAEAGMFYNTVTKKLYNGEKGIEVIPVFYKMTYPEWAPFEKREGRPVQSTGLKTSRQWNSLMEDQFENDPKTNKAVPAPMFSRVYKLNSVEQSGSFTWHTFNVNLLRKVDNASLYQMARDFHNSIKGSQQQAAAGQEESNY